MEPVVGAVLFAVGVATYFLIGVHAFVRVLGISCIVGGIYWSVERKIPVGIEGEPPSFHVEGAPAVALGVLMVAVGAGFLLFAPTVACWWDGSHAC